MRFIINIGDNNRRQRDGIEVEFWPATRRAQVRIQNPDGAWDIDKPTDMDGMLDGMQAARLLVGAAAELAAGNPQPTDADLAPDRADWDRPCAGCGTAVDQDHACSIGPDGRVWHLSCADRNQTSLDAIRRRRAKRDADATEAVQSRAASAAILATWLARLCDAVQVKSGKQNEAVQACADAWAMAARMRHEMATLPGGPYPITEAGSPT